MSLYIKSINLAKLVVKRHAAGLQQGVSTTPPVNPVMDSRFKATQKRPKTTIAPSLGVATLPLNQGLGWRSEPPVQEPPQEGWFVPDPWTNPGIVPPWLRPHPPVENDTYIYDPENPILDPNLPIIQAILGMGVRNQG